MKKILIVEDNELHVKLFKDLLRAHGADVEGVRDARVALDRVASFDPDLVIMDIRLPHIGGIDLIRQLRTHSKWAELPVMAVTAYSGKGDEADARKAGANHYLSKLTTVMGFVASVEEMIGPLGKSATQHGPDYTRPLT